MRKDARIDRDRILALLRERRDFVTGVELSRLFGVSRVAVNKHIKTLVNEGYVIETRKGRGYMLMPDKGDAFSGESIKAMLNTKCIGQKLSFAKCTGSTNRDIIALAEDGAPEGTMAVAEYQSSGRGRKGRTWQSPEGTAIAFSILLRPDFEPDIAPMITILMALSVVRGIRAATGLETGIKWPNDVVVSGKKVCGILTEMFVQEKAIRYVVIGVGINANMDSPSDFPEELQDRVTSVLMETGERASRSRITAECCNYFEELYDDFCRNGDLSFVLDEYNSLLVSKDKGVRVLDPAGDYSGVSRRIDAQGRLVVDRDDGERILVSGGEVSVRGIYGYV